VRLVAEEAGGDTYYHLQTGSAVEIHYTFHGGYLVAAPTRALVMRAVRLREDGETLSRAASFRQLFPADGGVNVSALVYQNLGSLVGTLAQAPGLNLDEAQKGSITALAGDARPTLLCAYGEPDAVRVAGLGGAFDLDAAELALPMLLSRLKTGTAPVAAP
jgi:hypothetical protein